MGELLRVHEDLRGREGKVKKSLIILFIRERNKGAKGLRNKHMCEFVR